MRYSFYLLLFFLFGQSVYSQQISLEPYLSNVVDLGGDNFGVIVGSIDNEFVAGVTVLDKNQPFGNGISVKFHQQVFESKAMLVKQFNLSDFTLVLFQCKKPPQFRWRDEHYDQTSIRTDYFLTFLDNGKSDNQWSSYMEPISFVNVSKGIATLRMKNNSLYSRGMPVFNGNGSLVALIASKADDDEKVTFEAIDFQTIETLLLDYARCKYFKMIRYGQKSTLCDTNEKQEASQNRKDAKTDRQNTTYGLALAPSFNPTFMFLLAKKSSGYAGFGYTAGLDFFIKPDDNNRRLILKPRYGRFNIGPEDAYPAGDLEPVGMLVESFEMPVVWESIVQRKRTVNYTFALAYTPGYVKDIRYEFTYNDVNFVRFVKPDSRVIHKLSAEIGFEYRAFRWGFYYAYQLNLLIDPDQPVTLRTLTITPFENNTRRPQFFGAQFSYRLWGSWLTKER